MSKISEVLIVLIVIALVVFVVIFLLGRNSPNGPMMCTPHHTSTTRCDVKN